MNWFRQKKSLLPITSYNDPVEKEHNKFGTWLVNSKTGERYAKVIMQFRGYESVQARDYAKDYAKRENPRVMIYTELSHKDFVGHELRKHRFCIHVILPERGHEKFGFKPEVFSL